MFGPTLRVRAGDTYTIRLTNNMTASGPASHLNNGFRDLQDSNLHTHGQSVNGRVVQTVPGQPCLQA